MVFTRLISKLSPRSLFKKSGSVNPENQGEPECWRDCAAKCDIVVGIDFGTTYSGCSYARQVKGQNITPTIKTINKDWPIKKKDRPEKYEKAPTNIIYNTETERTTGVWGQEAKNTKSNDNNLFLLGYFKLFLSPTAVDKQYGKNNKEIENIIDSFTMDSFTMDSSMVVCIIGDYLSLLRQHVEKHIKNEEKNKNLTFFYVLTIPAMWDDNAKELMEQAAIRGGLVKNNQRQNILMITEPEAAALSCEEHYKDYDKGEAVNFIVCDAGGGTVDLVTFRLENNIIRQMGEGTADTCGSSYIDDRFKEYLLEFYNDSRIEMPENSPLLNKPMDQFITKLKPGFIPPDGDDSFVYVSLGSRIPENFDTRGRLIRGNQLKVPRDIMKTEIFDKVIDKVKNLIRREVAAMTDGKIDVIIVVGGFSRSSYLRTELKETFPSIKIAFPNNPVTAISEGAVSYVLRPRMIDELKG